MTEFNTIMFSWKCVTPPGVARKSSSIILTKLATHHVATVKLQDVLKLMVKKYSFHCSDPLILQRLFVEEKAVILV